MGRNFFARYLSILIIVELFFPSKNASISFRSVSVKIRCLINGTLDVTAVETFISFCNYNSYITGNLGEK